MSYERIKTHFVIYFSVKIKLKWDKAKWKHCYGDLLVMILLKILVHEKNIGK